MRLSYGLEQLAALAGGRSGLLRLPYAMRSGLLRSPYAVAGVGRCACRARLGGGLLRSPYAVAGVGRCACRARLGSSLLRSRRRWGSGLLP
jgi:hypothetical protein